MNAAPTTTKTKRGSKLQHRRENGENVSKYGAIPDKLAPSSGAGVTAPRTMKQQRPSMMLAPVVPPGPMLEKTPTQRRRPLNDDPRRFQENKRDTSDKNKMRKSKTVKQRGNRAVSAGTPPATSRISPEPIKTTVKDLKTGSATQIATGKRKASSREKFKGRLSGKLGGDVASDDREKRGSHAKPQPNCDVCNESDRDVESNKPLKKRKNGTLLKPAVSDAALAAQAIPAQVASEENETLASVDADMPELALPNYCLPEGEFEDPAPMNDSSKRAH